MKREFDGGDDGEVTSSKRLKPNSVELVLPVSLCNTFPTSEGGRGVRWGVIEEALKMATTAESITKVIEAMEAVNPVERRVKFDCKHISLSI
jgi:hypothetical protein